MHNQNKVELLVQGLKDINDTPTSIHNSVELVAGLAARLSFDSHYLWESQDNAWMNAFYELIAETTAWKDLQDKAKNNLALGAIGAIAIASYNKYYFPTVASNLDCKELEEMLVIAQENNLPDQVKSLEQSIADNKATLALYKEKIKDIDSYAITAAINTASRAVDKAEKVLSGGGCNKELLPIPKVTNATTLAAVVNSVKLLSEDKTIDILKRVGRLLDACKGKRTAETKNSPNPTQGVTLGNDIGSLLPEEWLKDDWQFNIEFAEEKLSQYARGQSQSSAGDLIVLLDESCSMTGKMRLNGSTINSPSREVLGKAILMLMIRIANQQNRGIYLITFDSSVRRRTDLRKASTETISKVLSEPSNGRSTYWGDALREAIDILQGKNKKLKEKSPQSKKNTLGQYRKADIVIITDAGIHGVLKAGRKNTEVDLTLVTPEDVEDLNKLRNKLQFKVHGILVGDDQSEPQLRLIADRVIKITDLSQQGAISEVLSAVSSKK